MQKRGEIVRKIFNELHSNTLVNSDEENRKDYFFSLVKKNKELTENEKEYCKDKFIYGFELNKARNKKGKPKECNKCKSPRYSDKFCEGCISLQLQSLFGTWTSGNEIIDNFIQQCQKESSLPNHILEWIPFEQFIKVTKLTEGGFSSIYTAVWTIGYIIDYDENKKEFSRFGKQDIVLKSLNNSSNPGKVFFDEAINYCKIKSNLYLFQAINYCKIKSNLIVTCYGITKFQDDGNYAMVLNYVPEGNLRDYLRNHHNLTLKDRITIFRYLCDALNDIHEKDLIHCDLHSGNILLEGGSCYITDLGLCGPVDEKSSDKIYGIVSYVAPELLRGNINTKNTKETDIYSVGMLMWEIFAGHPPFDDRIHSHRLIFDICEGLRPPILPGMPDDYARMMQRCWDVDPSKRPTIRELWEFAVNKHKEILKNIKNKSSHSNNSLKRFFKFSKIKKHEIDFNNGGGSSTSQQAHKSHPDAYHTSRILDEEIAKSKSFKIYTSNDSSLNSLDFNSFL